MKIRTGFVFRSQKELMKIFKDSIIYSKICIFPKNAVSMHVFWVRHQIRGKDFVGKIKSVFGIFLFLKQFSIVFFSLFDSFCSYPFECDYKWSQLATCRFINIYLLANSPLSVNAALVLWLEHKLKCLCLQRCWFEPDCG